MKREKRVQKLSDLLITDVDLGFLLRLNEEVESLVPCIRERVDLIRGVK